MVNYDITHGVTGKYNLSFDLWITENPGKTNPPELNIMREIMIWQDYKGRNSIPDIWFVHKVTIDGEIYKFYTVKDLVTMSGTGLDITRDYMAFVKETPEYQGDTKIHEFLNYLVEHEYILPTEYLRNVDLGNEIWYGSGETILNDFTISIK